MTITKPLYIFIDGLPQEILLLIQKFYFQNLKKRCERSVHCSIDGIVNAVSRVYFTRIGKSVYTDIYMERLHMRRQVMVQGHKTLIESVAIIDHGGQWGRSVSGKWRFYRYDE